MAKKVKNLAAKSLALPQNRMKIVRSKKGKGAYSRNERHRMRDKYGAAFALCSIVSAVVGNQHKAAFHRRHVFLG